MRFQPCNWGCGPIAHASFRTTTSNAKPADVQFDESFHSDANQRRCSSPGSRLMCGIAGIARRSGAGVSADTLGRMAAAIAHRGPDGHGFYLGSKVGFAHVRLSIVDVARGAQPLTNEDGQVVITYNGEV